MEATKLDNAKENIQEYLDKVVELVKKRCIHTFSRNTSITNLEIEPIEVDEPVYAHSMAFIMIQGNPIRVVLKTHFTTLNAKCALAHRQNKQVTDIQERLAIDFVRELSNMTAGALKADFIDENIITGLSLPMVTRGFDELVFTDILEKEEHADAWRLIWDDGEMKYSVLVKIDQPELFTGVEFNTDFENEEDEDDEGEFL